MENKTGMENKTRKRRPELAPRKPGGGRKPKGEMPRVVALDLRLPQETGASLAAFAALEGMTRQDYALRVLQQHLMERQIV